MRKLATVLTAFLSVFIFSGCDAFFDLNLFEAFEKIGIIPTSSEIKKMSAEEIESLAGSDLFFEELSNDDGAKDDFIDRLQEIQTDPDSTDTEIQTAALIESEIYLETTCAGDAVNNMIDYLASVPSDTNYSEFAPGDVAVFVEAIIPSSAMNDLDTFTEMIEAFEASYTALMLYGSLIDDPNDSPDVDSANPGEIAMNALACSLIMSLEPQGGMSKADALWLLMNDNPSDDPPTDFNQDTIDNNSSLDSILAQAGLSELIPAEVP